MSESGKTFAGSTVRHGSASGWREHQKRGQEPCDSCKAAKSAYDKRSRAAPVKVLKSRLSARAQYRAYGRLAKLYPDIYRALYAEEKDRAFREAGLQAEAVRDW